MAFFVLIALGLIFATTSVNSANNIHIFGVTRERCSVSNVTINQCTMVSEFVCYVTRGNTITFNFDYRVKFYSLKPKIKIYILNPQGTTPFNFIEGDTNQYTPFPVVGFEDHEFSASFPVSANAPVGSNVVTVKFWDANTTVNVCEFQFQLGII